MSDAKLHLLRIFTRAFEVSTIKLLHFPAYSGIWSNESVDTLAKQALRSADTVDLNADIS
jgi:hypothetical protein